MTIIIWIIVNMFLAVIIHDMFDIHNPLLCLLAKYYANKITSSLFGLLIVVTWAASNATTIKEKLINLAQQEKSFTEIGSRVIDEMFAERRYYFVANDIFAFLLYLTLNITLS